MNDRQFASRLIIEGYSTPNCVSPTNLKNSSNSPSPNNKNLVHWSSSPSSQLQPSKKFLALPSPNANKKVVDAKEKEETDTLDPQIEKLARCSLKINTTASYLKQQAVAVSPHAPVTKRYHSEEQERKYIQLPLVTVNRSLTFFKSHQRKDNTLNGKLQRLLDSCNFESGRRYP